MNVKVKRALKNIVIGILITLVIVGVAFMVTWTTDNSGLSLKEERLVEIFAYDYIRIDGISYPTKDITELSFGYDCQYGYMELNDNMVIVRFSTNEYALYNEGCDYCGISGSS